MFAPWTGRRLLGSRPGRRELARPPGPANYWWLGRGGYDWLHVVGEPRYQPPFAIRSSRPHQREHEGPDRRTGHLESQSAWAYPAAAANSQGEVGISVFYGGGTRHPGHVVGIKTTSGWETQLSRTSTHGPADQSWGDYLSCLAHHDESSTLGRIRIYAARGDRAHKHRAALRSLPELSGPSLGASLDLRQLPVVRPVPSVPTDKRAMVLTKGASHARL